MTVSEPGSGVDLFGKSVTDLQENIEIGDDAITGTLKYVADYSAAFPAPEDSGNYIALKAEATAGASITAEVVGGAHGPVTLDADGIIVARVTSNEQSIKFVASKDGVSTTTILSLTDVVLTPEV